MVLVRLQFFVLLIFAVCRLKPSFAILLIQFIADLIRFGFQYLIFPGAATSNGWLQASVFRAADGDPFDVATGLMVPVSAAMLRYIGNTG
jgi:hypothetical protein